MYALVIYFNILVVLAAGFSVNVDPGVYPDPENCKNYYVCGPYSSWVDQECELYVCEQDLLFDDGLLVCNYQDQVECGDRPNPYASSTTEGPSRPTTHAPTAKTTTKHQKTSTTTVKSTTKMNPTTTTTKFDIKTTTTQRTTTTPNTITTTTHDGDDRWPKYVMGLYILLADNTEEGFEDDADWYPKLFEYQETGINVLFFTFIDPATMIVPNAFQRLAATRGTGVPGSVPSTTRIMFAIGGYSYSLDPNPWPFLTSQAKAEEMAEIVALWPDLYGCDGIDLDIESGAGDKRDAGPNMVHFIRRLRQLKPNIIIGQPTYGYPQVDGEDYVINESWNVDRSSNNLADEVGLMVYEGTQALNYVKNYAEGASQWEGFPIHVNVPYHAILLGCKGSARPSDIDKLASETLRQDLLGLMIWYASVGNGFQYEKDWDASTSEDSQAAYIAAMKKLS